MIACFVRNRHGTFAMFMCCLMDAGNIHGQLINLWTTFMYFQYTKDVPSNLCNVVSVVGGRDESHVTEMTHLRLN